VSADRLGGPSPAAENAMGKYLPFLDEIVPGNPRLSPMWDGTQYPVVYDGPPLWSEESFCYVLRVSEDDAFGELRQGDRALIQNVGNGAPQWLTGTLCALRIGSAFTLGRVEWDPSSRRYRVDGPSAVDTEEVEVLGICLGILRRDFR